MIGKFSSLHFVSSLMCRSDFSIMCSADPNSPCRCTYNSDTISYPSCVVNTPVADPIKLSHRLVLFSNLRIGSTIKCLRPQPRLNVSHYLPLSNHIPIVRQEIEQRQITVRSARQHVEFQEDVVLRKIAILFDNRNVQQPFNFRRLHRTRNETLQQVCSLALLSRSGEIDDSLQTEFPFLLGSPFKDRTNVLVANAKFSCNTKKLKKSFLP